MKAMTIHDGKTIKLEEAQKPSLPKGGAIVRILYASICGTDLRTYRFGNKDLADGRILGHEACSIIDEIDPSVKGFKAGDKVIVAPAIGCGECPSCKRGHTNTCETLTTIGFQYDGTFAEYCAIPAAAFKMHNVIKVPGRLSDIEACVAEPIACAINGQGFLNIGKEDAVLIYGAGYLGCIHAELAMIKGARKVILADISEKRRVQAEKDLKGVTVLDSADALFESKVKDTAGREGINVIITACPVGEVHRQALQIIYKNGRVSLFGGLPGNASGYLDSNLIHYKELSVYGVHASTPAQNEEALQLIKSMKLNVNKYISSFSLEKFSDAIESLKAEDSVKVVLNP